MADNSKINILNDQCSYNVTRAKEKLAEGNKAAAKKLYLMAALNVLDIALLCKGNLKRAKLRRALALVDYAAELGQGAKKKRASSGGGQGGNEGGNGGSEGDSDQKLWTAADIPDISFDDIAGLAEVKKTITTRMINPLKFPEKYARYDKKSGGGVLLYGPPGTGKTMIAKAIAHEVGATFYTVKSSDIVSKWVGESEKNIQSLFETARKDKLAIIFIDELDSLFGTRGNDTHNDRRVNEFLQQIDGFSGRADNLLLLGATNRPWSVDSAAMRSGRFSEKIYVPLPDREARKYLIERRIRKVALAEDIDTDRLADMLDGYSGADIDEVCDLAKAEPLGRDIDTDTEQFLTMADFEKIIGRFPPSVPQSEIEMYEKYNRNEM